MPVDALNNFSKMYNVGTLSPSAISMIAIILNGDIFVAFHEIAQLNIAKKLYEKYRQHAILEHPLANRLEADITLGNQVWEVKPDRRSATKQLRMYTSIGKLTYGEILLPIRNIPIIDDIVMNVYFPKPGVAWYYFNRSSGRDRPDVIKSTLVKDLVQIRKEITLTKLGLAACIALIFAGRNGGTAAGPQLEYITEELAEIFGLAA